MNVEVKPQFGSSDVCTLISQRLRFPALALVVILSMTAIHARASEGVKIALTKVQKSALEATISSHLQLFADSNKDSGFYKKGGIIEVRIDVKTATLAILLSREYIPAQSPGEVEDLQSELGTEAFELLRENVEIKEIKFVYDGKSLYDYFPEKVSSENGGLPSSSINTDVGPPVDIPGPHLPATPTVVISAGHGLLQSWVS